MNKRSVVSNCKIIYLLALMVLFTLIFQNPITSFAENTGTIELELRYENGDRISTYQTVLKIFQDKIIEPLRIIEFPESNPLMIESLPLDHKYTVKVYVNDMFAEQSFIILDEFKEKLEIRIPPQAGMKFTILYNDGSTPIERAKISIKSDEGNEWAKGDTDSNGETIRFWLQSNNLVVDDYYIAEISLGEDIVYLDYPITFHPNVIGNINIITPWTDNIENLIVIQVYKDISQKVKKEDGKFVVELYDSKNNKVAESQVNYRGNASFSNFKVDKYSIIVLKSANEPDGESEIWATKNTVITGDEKFITIYKKSVQPKSPIITCNCVAFRLDDVQDYYLRGPQVDVMRLFQQKNADLTVGIIGSAFGDDPHLVSFINRGLANSFPTLEVASHSYSIARLPTLDKNDQRILLEKTNEVLHNSLKIIPKVLIPPQNLFNDETIEVASELGFTHISAHIDEKHSPPYFGADSEMFYFPANTQTATLNPDGITWDKQARSVILEDIRGFIEKYGFAVVMMHPYEFTIIEYGAYTTETDRQVIEEVGNLIDDLREFSIEIVTISEINEKIIQPGQQTNVTKDFQGQDEYAHCFESFAPFVNLSNCNFSGQELFQVNLTAANLSGADFSEANLQRIDFTNVILTRSDLTEINFYQGILTGADLTYANLTNSKIEEVAVLNTNFSNAIMKGINISNLSAEGSNFSNVDISKAIVRGAGFSNTQFSNADLSNSDFSGINLSNSKFDGANLSGINLIGSILSGADLTGADLTGADLTKTILRDANISNAILLQVVLDGTEFSNSDLSGANLSGVDLTGTNLKGINFSNADLSNTNLSGVDLTGSILNGADLSGADLSEVILKSVNLSNTILNGINLSRVDLSDSNLDGVDLSNTILKGTNLSRVSLNGASIAGIDLSDSILIGIDFTVVVFDDVNFSNADLKESNFSGVDLTGSLLTGVNLSNADLSNTNLSGVDLTGSLLTGANLSNADLSNTNLSGVDLTGAVFDNVNFSNADMRRILLSGVDLSEINFSGADLKGADFSYSNLSGADFSGSILESADLFEAEITNTDFSGADLTGVDIDFKDIENAKTDDKTKLPEKGFFFFRELYSLLRTIFGF